MERESNVLVLSKSSIKNRAMDRWNKKSNSDKIRDGLKYEHVLKKLGLASNAWSCDFYALTKHQQSLLLKGELIRTYDSLCVSDKLKVKKKFNLSRFSNNWFNMDKKDKKTLLKVLIDGKKKKH